MLFLATATLHLGALPPGPGPFTQEVMRQPVPGAMRFPGGGQLCDVTKPPYNAKNGTNATTALSQVPPPPPCLNRMCTTCGVLSVSHVPVNGGKRP